MGTQLGVYQQIEAPPQVPFAYGIFSVVTPLPATDPHWRLGVQWQTQNCGTVKVTTGPCIDDEVEDLSPDNMCEVLEWEPFTVYVYNDDSTGGRTLEQHRQNTIARLLNGEQNAVETELLSRLTTAVPAPLDMTGFGDRPEMVLGQIEQAIAATYHGLGVIHMSRRAAIVLAEHLRVTGGQLQTILGTPVVASSAIDPPTSPANGDITIYGTGPLVMFRGEVDLNQFAIDRAVNTLSYIAQRDYVIGWDCSAVGARTVIPSLEEVS